MATNRKPIQHLPKWLVPIANAAGAFGVVIKSDDTWVALETPPTFEEIQKHVDGYVELLGIPNGNDVSDKSVMCVNEDGKIKELPMNSRASYIIGYPVVGDAVWIKTEYIS